MSNKYEMTTDTCRQAKIAELLLPQIKEFDDMCTDREDDNANVRAARALLRYTDSLLPDGDSKDDWERFYATDIRVIIGDKLFTFCNDAAIFEGLQDAAKYVIDQK